MMAKDDHDEMDLKDKKLSPTWNATGKLNFFFLGHKKCTSSLLTILRPLVLGEPYTFSLGTLC